MVALGLCLLYLTVLFVRSGRVTEFILPAQTGQVGYDGQFTYYIALDPLHAAARIARVCDVTLPGYPGPRYVPELHRTLGKMLDCEMPAYRYQRILHAALARLLALGQPALVPWAMLAINLAALALGTWALGALLAAERVSAWYALVYGLFGGIFFAVRVSTTEPLAYGLVLLAIYFAMRPPGRVLIAALMLALAALAKETTLFFVAGLAAYYLFTGRWRDMLRLSLIALVPFIVWQFVLRVWLGQFGIGSGGSGATPFEIIPYNGIWRILGLQAGIWQGAALLALAFFPVASAMLPSLWALWRSVSDFLRRQWHPYVFLLGANAIIFPFVPFSTYVEPLGIIRFLPGLVISVLLYAALRKHRRALLYSTLWLLFGILFLS